MDNSVVDTTQCSDKSTQGTSITLLPSPHVPSYLVWSILSACYFPPLGIIAVGFSIACKNELSAGQHGAAAKQSKIAFYCNVICPIGVLMVLFSLLLMTTTSTINYSHNRAFNFVKTLERVIDLYTLDVGQPPTTEQGFQALIAPPPDLPNPNVWDGPYIRPEAWLLDPWGNEYRYASPGRDGRPFDIWSVGLDGIDGTDDDIGNWMEREMVQKHYGRYR